MTNFFKRLWRDRRGNALVIAAGALPLVIGSAGLATDTIQWTLWKRQLQRAADSGAIAGVYAKIQGQTVTTAVDTDLTKNNQTKITLLSGYPDVDELADTSQYIKPVRVTLALQKKLGFSGLFLTTTPTITATATAAAIETGEYCVVSLENTATTGISIGGTAQVDLGCGMITNSTSLDAAVAFGTSNVDASPIAAVGGLDSGDNWASGTQLLPFTLAQEDPFKDVYPPAPSDCKKLDEYGSGNQNNGVLDLTSQTGTICLKETNGKLEIKGDVRLGSATYVLDATDLLMTTNTAKLSCTKCTIVLTSSSAATTPNTIGKVNITGGDINMTSPDSGPFKGIIFYQDRRVGDISPGNTITGNADSSFTGAFYFPSQAMNFIGTAGLETACVQLVARRVEFNGNAAISNTCKPEDGADSFKGRHVRLIA